MRVRATSSGGRAARAALLVFALAGFAGGCGYTRPVTVIDDELLTTVKVKTALLNESEADLVSIDVHTAHGVVTLSGGVPNVAAERRAVELARRIAGVVDVVSRLQIARRSHRDEPPLIR